MIRNGYMYDHIKKTKGKNLPLIFPIIFYTGSKTYHYSTDILNLFEDPDNLAAEILFKPIKLVDLNKIDDEELQLKIWYGIIALVLKKAKRQNISALTQNIKCFVRAIEKRGEFNFLETVFKYIFNVSETKEPKKKIAAIKHILTQDTKETMMTTLAQYFRDQGKQHWLQKGMERGMERGKFEGIQEGIEKGAKKNSIEVARKMLKENISTDVISQVTELSKKKIQSLKNN